MMRKFVNEFMNNLRLIFSDFNTFVSIVNESI